MGPPVHHRAEPRPDRRASEGDRDVPDVTGPALSGLVTADNGLNRMWVRSPDSLDAKALPGSDSGCHLLPSGRLTISTPAFLLMECANGDKQACLAWSRRDRCEISILVLDQLGQMCDNTTRSAIDDMARRIATETDIVLALMSQGFTKAQVLSAIRNRQARGAVRLVREDAVPEPVKSSHADWKVVN